MLLQITDGIHRKTFAESQGRIRDILQLRVFLYLGHCFFLLKACGHLPEKTEDALL